MKIRFMVTDIATYPALKKCTIEMHHQQGGSFSLRDMPLEDADKYPRGTVFEAELVEVLGVEATSKPESLNDEESRDKG